jgi:hypothetical protein
MEILAQSPDLAQSRRSAEHSLLPIFSFQRSSPTQTTIFPFLDRSLSVFFTQEMKKQIPSIKKLPHHES